MATKRWRGDAPKVAQVTGWTLAGTWEVGDIITFTIGTKTISYSVLSTTPSAIVTALVSMWEALTQEAYPEFYEMTASANSAQFRLTARTAGKPFTVTLATTEAGGGAADTQTIDGGTTGQTGTSVTANSGPNVVSLAANWEGNAAPVDGDDVIFDSGNSDVLYDLDQNGITPASIKVLRSFKGRIGLPNINADSTSYKYFEYRPTFLKYGNSGDAQTVTVTIEGGAGRIKLDQGTAKAIWTVNDAAQALEEGIPAVLFKGTHADNEIYVNRGTAGVAVFGGETSTLKIVNVGYRSNQAGDSSLVMGPGVTLSNATIVQTGGQLEINSAVTGTGSLTQYAGVSRLFGTGGLVQLTLRGGQCIYSTTGTLGGNTVVSGAGHLDFSQDLRAKTVTNEIEIYGAQAKFSDPNQVVGSLELDLNETGNSDKINIGQNVKITRGTPS